MKSFLRLGLGVLALSLAVGYGCKKKSVPNTPDKTVMHIAKELSQNRPEVLWDAAPESWRKDVNGLLAEAAGKADPEIWNTGTKTLKRAVSLLKSKKDLILQNEQLKGMGEKALDVKTSWDDVIGLLEAVVYSDLMDHAKAKNPDVRRVLAETGGKIMKHVSSLADKNPQGNEYKMGMKKFADCKATVVKTEGDKATLKLETTGEKPQEVPFVKIEGKWVPEELAEQWKSSIAEAKQNLSSGPLANVTADQKKQILSALASANDFMEKLEKANTKEEFEQMLAPLMFIGAGLLQGAMQGGPGRISPQLDLPE